MSVCVFIAVDWPLDKKSIACDRLLKGLGGYRRAEVY